MSRIFIAALKKKPKHNPQNLNKISNPIPKRKLCFLCFLRCFNLKLVKKKLLLLDPDNVSYPTQVTGYFMADELPSFSNILVKEHMT